MKQCVVVISLALLTLTSCSPKTPAYRPPYTEEDVRKFIQPGTSISAIIQRFGQPSYDEKNPKFEGGQTNVDEIVYFFLPFPPRGTKEDYAFGGFQVGLKEGKAVDWASTHRSSNL